MKKKIFILFITILFLNSCNDSEENKQSKELKCDYFNYEGSTFLITNDSLNQFATLYKYDPKSNFKKLIDSSVVKVMRDKYSKEKQYTINNKALATNYDYRILLNDTISYYISEIKSGLEQHGTMTGILYECGIVSYKINGNLISDYSELRIRFDLNEYNKMKHTIYKNLFDTIPR